MTDSLLIARRMERLQSVNEQLAGLFHRDPLPLDRGEAPGPKDPLVVCGLLGGKDVGKSTLINALVGEAISRDDREVGEGTARPVVYVHRAMEAYVRDRFRSTRGAPEIHRHEDAGTRNLAFVDMPDFDSELRTHEQIVREYLPLLDRILWVTSPQKANDRIWVEYTRKALKDLGNVYCVLNRADELLEDDDGYPAGAGRDPAERFWGEQAAWFGDQLRDVRYDIPRERQFLVCAKYPTADRIVDAVARSWGGLDDRSTSSSQQLVAGVAGRLQSEMVRLRRMLFAQVSELEAARIKGLNDQVKLRAHAESVRRTYELDSWVERLEQVCDPVFADVLQEEAFEADYCMTVAERLARQQSSLMTLADRLMEDRIEKWPALRWLYWLARWPLRRVGMAIASPGRAGEDAAPRWGPGPFSVAGRGLEHRIRFLIQKLEGEDEAVQVFLLEEQMPKAEVLAGKVKAEVREHALAGDGQWLEERSRVYRAGPVRRGFLWLTLLWFVIVQPLGEGILEALSAAHAQTLLHGLYKTVAALGAAHLLQGMLVVCAVYGACLGVMYSRCIREVRAYVRGDRGGSRAAQIAAALRSELAENVVGEVLRPLRGVYDRLSRLSGELAEVADPQKDLPDSQRPESDPAS
ncbi:MAG: 50S ribosome-binding GTPase [Phycisphaerae bacterium]|nr:50S ribosome-binding GTPase [Phycisphaerae bacterium]